MGLNALRVHQKVNSERWHYYADKFGVVLLQDAVQSYRTATEQTVPVFMDDLVAMVDGRYNHPSVIQRAIFNEEDCIGVFKNVPDVVKWLQQYDPSRLVDTNSGGPGNNLKIGDVNDIHVYYPSSGTPLPSVTQYAMIGESSGAGFFSKDGAHQYSSGKCGVTYIYFDTAEGYYYIFIIYYCCFYYQLFV